MSLIIVPQTQAITVLVSSALLAAASHHPLCFPDDIYSYFKPTSRRGALKQWQNLPWPHPSPGLPDGTGRRPPRQSGAGGRPGKQPSRHDSKPDFKVPVLWSPHPEGTGLRPAHTHPHASTRIHSHPHVSTRIHTHAHASTRIHTHSCTSTRIHLASCSGSTPLCREADALCPSAQSQESSPSPCALKTHVVHI